MAILDLLKRTKKRVDDAIPDFNVRQKAGNVLRQANQIRQNLPIAQESRRLTDMLSAQKERQAEQARLRREREIQARERRMEESRRRMDEMKAKEQERNRQREENNRTRQENINKLTTGAKKTAGWLAKQAFEIPTIQNVYQRGLDAKLAENAFNQSTKLQEAAAKTTDANKKDRLLKVSEQIKQPYVGQVGKDKNLKPQEFVKAGLEANLNILPFIPGLQGTAGLKGVSVASKAGKGAKLASKAKQAINLSLGGGQGAGFIDDLSKIGTSKAIKNLVGRNLASGTTTAAVKQISTPETKDMTVTDKLKQFATDVPINTLAGTVFEGGLGAGAKKASDLVSGVSKKVAPAVSRAKEGIASALQEPKFKPGFASTKPKAGLNSKKVIKLLNNDKKALREQREKSLNKNYYNLEIYKINEKIKDLKRGDILEKERLSTQPKVEGFTPAPEVKEPMGSSTKSLTKEAQERLSTQVPTADANIVIKSKNSKVPDLTKADIDQIARNTKKSNAQIEASYGQISAIKEGAKKPIDNIQASLTDYLRNPKKWEKDNVQPQKPLSSEEFVPTKPRTQPEQQELQSAINKAREQSQFLQSKQSKPEVSKPTIKLATKKSPRELVEEAINKQNTQKVVSEKVFGKEPEIPSTPQQRTQFEINQAKRDADIPQIKAVSKSEADRLKQERVIPEISIKRPQEETDKIIRERVFAKQPVVKLQSKTPTTPRTSRQLAEEAVQRATKEPISPEITPMARVSTKEDISVGKTPEIKTRRQQIKETAINADDDATQKFVIEERKKDYKALEAQYQKIKNDKSATFEDLYKEHESGNYTPGTEKIHKILKDFLDDDLEITKERFGTITPIRENYIHHTTKESALRNITEGVKQGVGDVLYTAGFAKRRTGALKDYTYGMEGALAHLAKAMGPVGQEQKAFLRTANVIKNQLNEYNQALVNKTTKTDRKVDVFSIIKDNFPSKSRETTKYAKLKSDWSDYLRSIFNTSFRQKDDTFTIRQDFIKPFTNAERDYSNKLFDLTKLSTKELKNTAEGLGIRLSEKPNRVEMMGRLSMYYKKEYFGPATETFIRNVGKADATNNPNLITLINDIGELYINKELREVNVLEQALGTIRQQFSLGMIGANIGNSVQNTLETTKSFAFAGLKNTAAGVKDYFSGKGRELKRKYYGARSITQQFYEKEGLSGAYSNIVNTISPALYSLQQISEDFKDTVLLGALERKATKKGLTGDRLQDYVENNFQELAIKMGGAEDIKLFTPGQGGQVLKTIGQFMQYRIKDTVKFADSIHNALARKGFKNKVFNEDMAFAFNYTVNSLATGFILQQGWALGQRAFGPGTGFVPFDLAKDITEGRVVGPIGSVAEQAYDLAMAFQMEEGSKRDEKINEAQQKLNNLAIGFIVPAYGQIRKGYDYYKARERGYFETTGKDKNVANLVTEDNWGKIRAYLLGGSYDPERQQYFKDVQREKSPNLGKQESAVFREVKERGGIESAKQYFNSILGKREADKALKSLEEGANAQKPAGMSDEEWTKIKATNEAYILSGLATTDDFINYYARDIEFGKSGAERTKNETKVFALVNQLDSEEKFKKLSPEQKDDVSNKLLEKAGIKRDIVDYYNKSKNSVVVKYQMALEEIEDNLSKNPNFDIFNYLKEGRKKINTKQFASQEVLKMLQQDGLITEDEYKVLNKTNFLYLDGEFKDRSVAVKLKGKGGKGGKGKKIKLAPVPKAKDTIEILRLKRQKLPTLRLATSKAKTPVLRLAKSTKSEPKKLTVRKIRVK